MNSRTLCGAVAAVALWLVLGAPWRAAAAPEGEERWRKPTEAERKAVMAAIEGQLKAFKANDYAKAEKYQSRGLRGNFESLEEFRGMMKRVYPQFASYRSVTFGEARADPKGERVEILADVTGMDGVTVRALYEMVREEGEYRVGGVQGGMRPVKTQPRDIV